MAWHWGNELSTPVSDADVTNLLQSIDRQGYGVIENAVSKEEINRLRDFVELELKERGRQYFSFVGTDGIRGTLLEEISHTPAFQSLLAKLASTIMSRSIEQAPLFQVLRVVSGDTGRNQSLRFHYDAFAVTALVPISIPEREPRGSLILYPNLRPIRSSVIVNLTEKALLQNRISQKLFSTKFTRNLFKAKTVNMEPGNIYFFRGYQSLHANEPCDPSNTRATALFHFGDPHHQSSLTKFIKRTRERHEARKARDLAVHGPGR